MNDNFEAGCKLYEEATRLRDAGSLDQAIAIYLEAYSKLEPVANRPLRICLLFDLALAYEFSENVALAQNSFERSLKLYQELKRLEPDDPGVENLLSLIGQIEEQLDRIGKAQAGNSSTYMGFIDKKRWLQSSMPISVYIESAGDQGFDADLAEFAFEGFKLWANSSQFVSVERAKSLLGADIVVTRLVEGLGASGGQTAFETRLVGDSIDTITRATIVMYSPDRCLAKLSQLEKDKFLSLAAHEAGHALGLDGHSPYGGDLMHFKSQKLAPSKRDLRTLQELYLA